MAEHGPELFTAVAFGYGALMFLASFLPSSDD